MFYTFDACKTPFPNMKTSVRTSVLYSECPEINPFYSEANNFDILSVHFESLQKMPAS